MLIVIVYAPDCRLFTYVDEERLFSRPTYAAFIALLDNYNPNFGVDEDFTVGDQKEQDHFLDTIMATKVMTKTVNFLVSKGMCSSSFDFLQDLWNGGKKGDFNPKFLQGF